MICLAVACELYLGPALKCGGGQYDPFEEDPFFNGSFGGGHGGVSACHPVAGAIETEMENL